MFCLIFQTPTPLLYSEAKEENEEEKVNLGVEREEENVTTQQDRRHSHGPWAKDSFCEVASACVILRYPCRILFSIFSRFLRLRGKTFSRKLFLWDARP